MDKISINYTGGSHGNFLEIACNYIFFKIGIPPSDRVTVNGTYHRDLIGNEQLIYNLRKRFVAFPFWWLYPHPVTQNWPKVPYPLEKTIINISSKSLEEIALLRMYWRRRGDGFFLSPEELLNTSKTEFLKLKNNVSYPIKWKNGEKLASDQREVFIANVTNLYKSEYLSEIEVIRFWMDPFQWDHKADYDWMINTSDNFIDSLKESHNIIDFEMKWFYNPSLFLDKIKYIGNILELEQQISDDEIRQMSNSLVSTIYEMPENLDIVQEKFLAVTNKQIVDLSTLTLNEKIGLVTMMNVKFNLWYDNYNHLTEFPNTTENLIDLVNK